MLPRSARTEPPLKTAELPFISVIVPYLNQSDQLRTCLRSLEMQDYPSDRFEVIVVDNGSRELPHTIVSEFANVRLEQEPTPGPGPARNHGVTVARGEVLAFIDADELAVRGWLMSIGYLFAASNAAIVLGGDVRIAYRDPAHLTVLEAYESVFAYRQKEYIERYGFSGAGNLAVRKADFLRIGGFEGIGVAEDRVWGRLATDAGFKLIYVPEMVTFHPARTTFAELGRKWDRHVLHEFEEWQRARRGMTAWAARTAAVALSAIVDIHRIVFSSRLSGFRARAMAAAVLARIRIYRAHRMTQVLLQPTLVQGVHSWNRPPAQ